MGSPYFTVSTGYRLNGHGDFRTAAYRSPGLLPATTVSLRMFFPPSRR